MTLPAVSVCAQLPPDKLLWPKTIHIRALTERRTCCLVAISVADDRSRRYGIGYSSIADVEGKEAIVPVVK